MRLPLARAARRLGVRYVLQPAIAQIPRLTRNLPHARRRREGLEIRENVRYCEDHGPRQLDVYRLEGAPPQPALVYIHGGGFASCSRATHVSFAARFARQGYTVFNLDYRLAPDHPFPAAIDDVCTAMAFIAKHADRFGADPEQLILAGESAGANLALSALLARTLDTPLSGATAWQQSAVAPRAALLGCGVFQVSDVARLWGSEGITKIPGPTRTALTAMEEAYLGRGKSTAALAPLVDPLPFIEQHPEPAKLELPPLHVFVGTGDALHQDSVRLHQALERDPTAHELHEYADQPHAFHALSKKPEARACWDAQLRFLKTHVRDESPASSTSDLRKA